MTISVPARQEESRQAPPSNTVQEFSDPHEYQSLIRGADVRINLTTPGQYRAKLTKVDLHRLWMQRGESSLPYVVHSAPRRDRGFISFLADTRQAPSRHNGLELLPGTILVSAPGTEFHRRSPGGRWAAMSLTLEDLATAGQAIVGRELTAPRATQIIRPPPHLMSRLLQLHEAAGRLAETVPDVLAHPEVARAMEQALVQVVVECLTADPVGDTKVHNHTRIPVMQRLERVLEASSGRDTLYTGGLRGNWCLRTHTPFAMPGVSRDEPQQISLATTDELGTAGTCDCGAKSYDGYRCGNWLWLLGAGAVRRCVPEVVRGIAFGDIASHAE